MSSEGVMNTIQNTEPVDVNCPLPATALKMTYESTLLKVSNLNGLMNVDKALLTKMTDLDIDFSDADMNSQRIDEALAILKNCPKLNSFRLKMPQLVL